jgi:rubrerythrin
MDAFEGESQANRKYLAFAKQAENDGYIQKTKRLLIKNRRLHTA